MIILTTLRGDQLAINDQLIERVEDDNETRVILIGGTRYIVAESVEEIVQLCQKDRAEVQALAHRFAARLTREGIGAGGATDDGECGQEEVRILPFERHGGPLGGIR
jgi:flagellar protein FlbD